jgi:hypothetical protein
MIPKDIMICDWHYERADVTAAYFATKGFTVATCPWRNPEIAAVQLKNMVDFRQQSTPEMRVRFHGVIQTVWSGADGFLKQYYNPETYNLPPNATRDQRNQSGDARSLKRMMEEFKQLTINN